MGYIAIQCPENEHYHIQSENMYVEILNEDNQPCKEGEIGKVVVTPLHSFAMPLIRYAIGDYAKVGGICSCGRKLPVLTQIMGRVRNMLVLPTGETRWPRLNDHRYGEVAPVIQHQVVQKSLDEIEVRLVVERALSKDEENQIKDLLISRLDYPFKVKFSYPQIISHGKNGKFEEFLSEINS